MKGDRGLQIPQEYMRELGKRLPKTMGKALRDTVFDVRTGIYAEMLDSFDRPTPFIVPSNIKRPGKRGSLFAEYDMQKFYGRVWVKDIGPTKGAEPIILPHIVGGQREYKRMEKALYREGILPKGMQTVPGRGARLNKYGNIPGSQITQMLSYLKANPDYRQNRTAASEARAKAKAEKKKVSYVSYFVVRDRRGEVYGIKKRTSRYKADWFLIFVDKFSYEKRLEFQLAGELTIQRQWPKNFAYWAEQALDAKRPVAA